MIRLFMKISLEILKLPTLHDSKHRIIFHYSFFTLKVFLFSFVWYLLFFLVIPATPPCCLLPVKTLRLLDVFRLLTLCRKMSSSVGNTPPLLTGPVLICDILKSTVQFFFHVVGLFTVNNLQCFELLCYMCCFCFVFVFLIFIVFSVLFVPLGLLDLHVTEHLLN